jgi:type IV pilus assembly protein PilA
MELLILIAAVLVLTLIAIPNFSGMKIETNENAAIASLRSIYDAEVRYQAAYPAHGFACSLSVLGGKPGSASPSPQLAQLLANDLSSGRKSGYRFAVTSCIPSERKYQLPEFTGFQVTAVPQSLGRTGHRGFCIDQQGETKADPAGGVNCSQSVE